jgi:ABC-2 type transporter
VGYQIGYEPALVPTHCVLPPRSSFVILLTFLAGGFVLSKGSTHPWTIWLYWATPLSYAQNALSINEFAVRAPGQMLAKPTLWPSSMLCCTLVKVQRQVCGRLHSSKMPCSEKLSTVRSCRRRGGRSHISSTPPPHWATSS